MSCSLTTNKIPQLLPDLLNLLTFQVTGNLTINYMAEITNKPINKTQTWLLMQLQAQVPRSQHRQQLSASNCKVTTLTLYFLQLSLSSFSPSSAPHTLCHC